jgi:hypothetical protein
MFKKLLFSLPIVLLFLALFLTGCTVNPWQTFTKAMEKTDGVTSAKQSVDIKVHLDFPEDKEHFFALDELTIFRQYHHARKISQTNFYARVNGMGIDGKVYRNENDLYLLTPLIPKIIVLATDRVDLGQAIETQSKWQAEQLWPREETLTTLANLWQDLLNKENVASLGNVVLATPEGDVKAKKFTINLTSDELKPMLVKSAETIFSDGLLHQELAPVDSSFLPDEITKWFEAGIITEFNYLAFLNRDNYIIEEQISMTIDLTPLGPDFGNFSFAATIKRWDINKSVAIQFPELNPDNTFIIDEINDDMFKMLVKEND